MDNKQIEKTIISLIELVDLQRQKIDLILELVQNLDSRLKLDDTRLTGLERDLLELNGGHV